MHRRLISIALSAVAAAAVAGVLIAGTGASARCARCRVLRAVDGDATGLRAALDNLLENAARHGASTVRVSLTGHRVVVDDDGPVIEEADRERVFARFARGAHPAVPGSGLGVAIVAQQARLHSGRAYATDSPLGGARLVLELTRANAPTTLPSPEHKAH